MKYSIVFIFFFINIITSQSQSLLIKKNPKKLYKYDPGKYFDKKEYKIFATPQKSGTFLFTGRPMKATNLLLNLNGKFSLLPIEGIFVITPKKLIITLDTIKPIAKILYNIEKGKVYALPLDNMPCLVPQINSNMPVAKLDMKEYKKIPNALQEQKLIPQTETSINPSGKNNQ